MIRRVGMVVVCLVVAACQSGGGSSPAATPGPTSAAATVAATPTSVPATPVPTSTKPRSLPRTTDFPIDGRCENPDLGCLGTLVAGKEYTTTTFKPTVKFTVPPGGWDNPNEAGGEMPLFSTTDVGDVLFFFSHATSADPHVGYKVADISGWLQSNADITATPATEVSIGGLKGVTMDLEIAPGTPNRDQACPVQVCVPALFRGVDPDPNDPYLWKWDWGLAGTEKMRIYLLDANGVVVLLIADSIDGTTFDRITASFDAMAPTIAFEPLVCC
jgi:hypothetical protein